MRESITFLRLRPAESVNDLWAATRRREGTTAVEIPEMDSPARAAAIAGGLLPVATGIATVQEVPADPIAWVR